LKAAKKGYFKFSIMDAGTYIQQHENIIENALRRTAERAHNFNAELEQRVDEECAEQSYSDEQLVAEIDRQYEETNIGLSDHERQTPEEFVKHLYETIERTNIIADKSEQAPTKGEEIDNATANWLRGEYEYLQRKMDKGRELDDYEKGLVKKYEALQMMRKKKTVQSSDNAVEEEDASAQWLRGEYEFLQRKRAKGQELDDYEKGLERQYEELQSKNGMTQCRNCNQSFNTPLREKKKISCPACGHWQH
jgi:hypothetical protein